MRLTYHFTGAAAEPLQHPSCLTTPPGPAEKSRCRIISVASRVGRQVLQLHARVRCAALTGRHSPLFRIAQRKGCVRRVFKDARILLHSAPLALELANRTAASLTAACICDSNARRIPMCEGS